MGLLGHYVEKSQFYDSCREGFLVFTILENRAHKILKIITSNR